MDTGRSVRCSSFALAACAVWAALAGCTSRPPGPTDTPPPETPVREVLDQPADRIAEIDTLNDWRDRNQFDMVLAGLDDPDEHVRKAAARRAEKLLGKAIPFHSSWPDERRAKAIDAYRRLVPLAQEHDKTYLIDLVPVLLDRIETGSPAERQQTIDDTVLLTGITFGLRADDPPDVQQARIAMYRRIWDHWNKPGNTVLDLKRSPATPRP